MWAGAGIVGCFGMIFILVVIVLGFVALSYLNQGPDLEGQPLPQPTGVDPQEFPEAGGAPPGAPAPSPVPDATGTGTLAIEGSILDARSQRGIPDALIVLLVPGVRPLEFVQAADYEKDALVASQAQTDTRGSYRVEGVARGYTYSVLIGAEGYMPMAFEDGFIAEMEDPPVRRMQPVHLKRTD